MQPVGSSLWEFALDLVDAQAGQEEQSPVLSQLMIEGSLLWWINLPGARGNLEFFLPFLMLLHCCCYFFFFFKQCIKGKEFANFSNAHFKAVTRKSQACTFPVEKNNLFVWAQAL